MVPSTTERARQLHLAQLFHGPAQHALAYTYSYAYTQSNDVLGYIKSQDLSFHFNDGELALLAKTRSAKLFTLPVLYKIFKLCCSNKLEDTYSREWDAASATGGPTTLESHIAALHARFANFVSNGAGDVDGLVGVILGVVKKTGEKLGVNKWKQQYDCLKKSIDEILEEVHPGMDVKERVANAARIESDLRCQSVADAMTVYRSNNRRISMLDQEDMVHVEDLPYNITLVTDRKDRHGNPTPDEAVTYVEAEDILEVLRHRCSEKIDGKKICCVSGEHGTGKSSLASSFPVNFCKQDNSIKDLFSYDYVLLVSGSDIENTCISKWVGNTKSQRNDLDNFIDDYWSVVEAFLPRCCSKYGVKNVGHLLTTKNILFIIDDVDEISESKVKELILFLGQIIFDSSVLLFGSIESISKIKYSFISFSSVQHFHLHGVSKNFVLELSQKFREPTKSGKKKVQKSLRDILKGNMSRLGGLLEYPEIVQETLSLWKTKPSIIKDVVTASELLWNLLLYKSNGALEVNLDKDVRRRKKWEKWAMVVGENCSYCFKSNMKLNQASMEEIKESSDKIFSSEESERLMSAFFKKRLVFHADTFQSIPSSTCKPQMEYISSYYLANKLRAECDFPLKNYLPKTQPEELIALIAGHIKLWVNLKDFDGLEEEEIRGFIQKMLEIMVNYDTDKREDIQFLLKIATEFRGSHKLVQLLVNVTEYPEEWDLKLCYLQQRSLEIMLQHVSPVRIILRTDDYCHNYEQLSVLKFLCKVTISVWFESRQQFEFGSTIRMDQILRPFLSNTIMARVDLFSGCLSRTMAMDVPDFKSMSYLVMLALKVTDENTLSAAVALPTHLPQLLWFELKIDMSIENVVLTALPNMKVEMLDVYLRDLDDLCVPQITGLLTKLHKRYSGIHLEDTTLSPESIYTLLKELKQRDIALCATKKSVDKYRRWYYPLLSNLPGDNLLTDKEVKSILGFDDRKFYSDHKIQSSIFVKSIDAWNLTSYLEELKEIKYFTYIADNLSFTKTLKGTVETEHFSSIKVDTTGEII